VSRIPANSQPAGERNIDVGDGVHLHVVSSGVGAPLMVVHGFTGSTVTWEPLREALAARFTIHAVDLPGHGRSGAPRDPERHRLARLASDLSSILGALGLERAAVLGYSLGGRAALRLALDHPDRVAALVLESVSPGIVDPVERAERLEADAALADAIERAGIVAFVDRWERLPLWTSQTALPAPTRAALRAQRLTNQAHGLAASLRGAGPAADPPVLERLAGIDTPTLLIAGALDPKYVALGRLMERAIPRARLSIVDGAGHAVHLERPAAFATLVADFLGAVR
jgi:2-succinyl-6-hydroxy-2,4-cyclohexadiene-1-carboxylate synthase